MRGLNNRQNLTHIFKQLKSPETFFNGSTLLAIDTERSRSTRVGACVTR